MIDPPTAKAFDRIASVQADLAGAFAGGFAPRSKEFASARAPIPDLDPLSVAAPEGTYFVTGDRNAPQFTRDGCFRLVDGELRTAAGVQVLGAPEGSTALAPLRIDPVDRALGRASDVHIEGDGTLAYARAAIDPVSGKRTSERVAVGRLALARFPAGTAPARVDGTRVTAPAGTPVHIGLPGSAQFGGLLTYSRDGGSVDFNGGLARLQEAYMLLDAVRAAGKAHGTIEKTTLDLVK